MMMPDVCRQCGGRGKGKVDPGDHRFYCFNCWDKFNAQFRPQTASRKSPPPEKKREQKTPPPPSSAPPPPYSSTLPLQQRMAAVPVGAPPRVAAELLALEALLNEVAPIDFGPARRTLDSLTPAELPSKSIVARCIAGPVSVQPTLYDGRLSPRGSVAERYIRGGPAIPVSQHPKVSAKDVLLLTTEDIVAQIYVLFDEDVTKVILNCLDRLTSVPPEAEYRIRDSVAAELWQSLGDDHFLLVRGIVENSREVFLRLLEEFCTLEDGEEALRAELPQYGPTVRFVKSRTKGASEQLSASEKWLKRMTHRYRQMVEENELNKIFRKDLRMSGVVMPPHTLVSRGGNHLRFHIPAPKPAILPRSECVSIEKDLPTWTHAAFVGISHLNPVQSQVFDAAFHSSQNLLVCAPTGAGKTNVALLVMLRLVHEQMHDGVLDKDFKIIYVAPMKALAQEMVTNFSKRLFPYGIAVRELTGDMQLTKREIATTNVIVTTPEKWDVVTRKQVDNDLVKKTRLMIFDEIHLLNSDRGPVLEAVVSRVLRLQETDANFSTRLVGLSATLPNYKDVASFLRVDIAEGLKAFGPEYRPVPLEQSFVGSTDTSQRTEEQTLDRLAYDEVVQHLRDGHQVMVFVHSRKQTLSLAKYFVEEARKLHEEYLFESDLPNEIWKRASKLQGHDLFFLFQRGLCCHHAGMIRYDRSLVEDLFRLGSFKCLVCTATLAWGVNLPAHTVIIRGTDIYDSKNGGFVPLGILDVMQIFGRAGRPQYDTSGHGIIISNLQQIHHYLRLVSQALPIESQFMQHLPDHLNAEIHAGTVTSIAEGVRWLEFSYLWQRIRVNPLHYGLTIKDVRRDPELRVARSQIIARAAATLNEACMARYNPETGSLDTTELGRIASHYYVEHQTIQVFSEHLRQPDGTFVDSIDLGEALNIIACANEFTQLRARNDELDELLKIHERLPKRIRAVRLALESVDDTSVQWKVVTLLKAYVCRIPVNMHSLVSDMNYVIQNAGRICRALFEIELHRGHPNSTCQFLAIARSIERRLWPFEHPVRQFEYDLTDSVLANLEEKKPSISTLRELTSREVGDLVRNHRLGSVIFNLVKFFPTIDISLEVQPITRTILRVKVTISPQFTWNDKYHGSVQPFWLFVEDQDNNFIYHHEQVFLRKRDVKAGNPVVLNLTIPITIDHDIYCVRLYSERWNGAEDEYAFSVGHLHLPDDAPPTTKLLPLTPLSRDAIPEEFHTIYEDFSQLNPIQSQVFHTMFHTDSNVLLGAPTGSGKTLAAEMAMLRLLQEDPVGKVVYVAPLKALVKERMKDWGSRFDSKMKCRVVELSGDITPDIAALASARILCTTPEKWDGISRNWQVRSYVTSVRLVIFDEIHMLGTERGPIIEVIVSRMRYIGWHKGKPIRLIGLSTAVANPGDLGSWLGVEKKWAIFNFDPSVRPVPMRCHIAGYPGRHYCPRMACMNKPTYNAIIEKSPSKPVIVFVSSRRQTRLTALALINFLVLEQQTAKFVRMTVEEIVHTMNLVQDPHLKHCLQFGIGIHHAGLVEGDKACMEELFRQGKLQILVATSTLAWGVNFPAHMVVVKGTEYYDTKTHSYIDYPITDLLQMIGRAGRPQYDVEGVAQVLCHEPKKSFFRKFLYDPFPVESSLHKCLHAHMNAEIVAGTVASRQDAVDYLTWTYLFRRLVKNPSYYGAEDPTPMGITAFLSGLVRKVISDLEESRCVEAPELEEEGDPQVLRSTVLGRIASYYYLSHISAARIDAKITADADCIVLLKLLCEAEEYEQLPVRHNEDKLNIELAARVPLPVDIRCAESPHVKVHLLFQTHFARVKLPIADYLTDLKSAIDNSVRILQSMVDIAANNGHLFSALRCMNLLQCMVQARWWHESPLLQLPHVSPQIVADLASQVSVTHIAELANATTKTMRNVRRMLSDPRYGLGTEHVDEVMHAIRRLPLIDVKVSFEQGGGSNMQNSKEGKDAPPPAFTVWVELTRLSMPTRHVVAPKFPKQKDEQFWLALGHEPSGELVALKRINRLRKTVMAKLVIAEFDNDWIPPAPARRHAQAPPPTAELQLYVVCDSYLGLDQQYTIRIPRDNPAPAAAESLRTFRNP